jgi:hypothetical protein
MASEQTKEYTLKTGSHTWIDGKTYTAGDPDNNKMQLTREQMERIGKERFEGQTVDTTNTEDVDKLKEENRQLREQLAQVQQQQQSGGSGGGNYSDLLSSSVPEITSKLQSVADLSALAAIQTEESKDGRPRVGVLKAIEQRREELSNQG